MPDDLQSDIQATAEDIAADSDVLRDIETEKATLDATDPRVLELSKQAKSLVQVIAAKTAAQHELVLEANGLDGPDAPAAEPAG